MSKMGAYIHSRPDGTPFYIGKGSPARMNDLKKNRNKWHRNITNKYGHENIIKNFIECSNEKNALDLEIGLIKTLRANGYELCNLTLGGEGVSGFKQDPLAIERMRQKLIGRVQSPEERQMRSQRLKGIKKSKPMTDEHRRKLGLNSKGKRWFQNGTDSIFCLPDDCPEGYTLGRLTPWFKSNKDKEN